MPVKIRLARQGKKRYAHYAIVIADSRAPRDGRFIEKIGTYNPNVNPFLVEINFDRALYWVQTGAQPTDTCRRLLSSQGVLLKDHLLRGVKKGALTEAQVEEKFNAWVKERDAKLEAQRTASANKKQSIAKQRLDAEIKVKEAKLEILNKKKAEAEAAAKAADEAAKAAEAAATEHPAAEANEAKAE